MPKPVFLLLVSALKQVFVFFFCFCILLWKECVNSYLSFFFWVCLFAFLVGAWQALARLLYKGSMRGCASGTHSGVEGRQTKRDRALC